MAAATPALRVALARQRWHVTAVASGSLPQSQQAASSSWPLAFDIAGISLSLSLPPLPSGGGELKAEAAWRSACYPSWRQQGI